MRAPHILYAAAAFWLVSAPSVNTSEAINVSLPSQYQVIWDQTPFTTPSESVVDRRPVRLEIEVPSQAAGSFRLGFYARSSALRGAGRG